MVVLFNLTCLWFPRSQTLVIIHCKHHTAHTTPGEVGFKAAQPPCVALPWWMGKVLSVAAFLTPSLPLDVFQHVMISCKWTKLKSCTVFQDDYNFIIVRIDLKIKTKKIEVVLILNDLRFCCCFEKNRFWHKSKFSTQQIARASLYGTAI